MSDSPKNFTDDELVEKSRSQLGGGTPIFSGQIDPTYQVEMMRRLKDSIDKFNKVTTRFSWALVSLSAIMIIVSLLQLFKTSN